MSESSGIGAFPFYGFTWNFYSRWVSKSLDSGPVNEEMYNIWVDYVRPLHVTHIRFNIQVVKYKVNPRVQEEVESNRILVNRLINLCRFADANNVQLFPILMGMRHNREHLLGFSQMVYGFVREFLSRLEELGESHLYDRISAFQIENEMGHPVRHMFWLSNTVVSAMQEACERVRQAEREAGVRRPALLSINYSYDLFFKNQFLRTPLRNISAFVEGELPDFATPSDLAVFLGHPAVDVIGVDFFPETWSPFAKRALLLELVRTLCDRYGPRSPFKKRILVAETGFANLVLRWKGDQGQLEYYQDVLRQLSDYYWTGGGREDGFVGLMWYCLSDTKIRLLDGAGAFTPGEYRFGVVSTMPPNSYDSYPAIPKPLWYWLRDNVIPFASVVDPHPIPVPGGPTV
jgi:hypothetical protein